MREKKLYNLHTHTYRCGHGSGDIQNYIMQAQKDGVEIIGFAEHTPLPDAWWAEIRMHENSLQEYVEKIDIQQHIHPEMLLYKGLECDYFEEYADYYRMLQKKYSLDYLIGSVHAYLLDGMKTILYEKILGHIEMKAYTEQILMAMYSKQFLFIAHPDLFCLQLGNWDQYVTDCCREICKAAAFLQIPLEINVSGYQKSVKHGYTYPNEKFWKIASDFGVTTVINTDAHCPEDLVKNLDRGYLLQQQFHLKDFDMGWIGNE